MDENINNILIRNRVFSLVDEDIRHQLASKFTQIELPAGETLFNQGDRSNAVYIVVRGKLSAEFTADTGDTKIVGHADPDETVGEIGALLDEPRLLTIKAIKDSILLKISAKDFSEICHQFPALMLETIRPTITRSNNLIQKLSAEKSNKHIVIIPANKDTSLEKLSEKLLSLGEHFRSLLIFSDYHPLFNVENEDVASIKAKITSIAKDRKARRILYILKSYDSPLAHVALRKTDMLYIAGFSHTPPKIDKHILDKIYSNRLHLTTNPELILLHHENTKTPQRTTAWLALTPFALHHHIRIDVTKDFNRLLRFIRGKAVGLVFSGGGTRGWAHLGAIKALIEMKIPIDIIGGTSVGALVAACYAMNQSYNEAYEKFYRIVESSNKSISWRSVTWPIISIFDAERFTKIQMEVFDNILIEDMWLPYFCLSCNLATNNEEIHRTGVLWEKTRASTSIPGLIPPMLIDGDIHLDGGLLNNLPVDVMRRYIGNKGKVIAIDLNSYAPDPKKYLFPPIITLKESIVNQLGINITHYKYPRFIDTFLRGLFVGSLLKSKQNSLASDVFVSLNLSKFKLLHSNPQHADQIIEIGYQETLLKCMYQMNKSS